jgi:hypothetical protein
MFQIGYKRNDFLLKLVHLEAQGAQGGWVASSSRQFITVWLKKGSELEKIWFAKFKLLDQPFKSRPFSFANLHIEVANKFIRGKSQGIV